MLLQLQAQAQKKWEDSKLFEAEAPAEGAWQSFPVKNLPISSRNQLLIPLAGEVDTNGKFFGNFPYPYMNGLLHLGHAFSLSKVVHLSR